MVHRELGRTGLRLSPIGFGAFKIGRNQKTKYAQAYELPDEAAVARLLNGVLDAGINLIDTAPAYGLSEQRIGETISNRRGEYALATKIGEVFENGKSRHDFTADGIVASVSRSLANLRTDHVDLLFIHSDGDDARILQETDAVETLRKLKAAGLTRFIGLSGKTPAGARLAFGWADAIMVEYHADDVSHGEVMGEAKRRGVGVIVKKALNSGAIKAGRGVPFVLQNGAVNSVVIGSLSVERMRENLRLAEAVE